MSQYIVFDGVGEILRTGSCRDSDLSLQAKSGETVMAGLANDLTQYVSGGVVFDKASMGVLISTIAPARGEVVVLSHIPIGAVANVDGETVVVDDGILEVTFDTGGDYGVRITRFPYLNYEVTIQCN